jgi:GT2 family glycosyltransferase
MTLLRVLAVNYFGSATVARLVASLAAQNDGAWELVVIDNSESVAETERLQAICSSDERIQVRVAPANLGYFGGAEWERLAYGQTATWTAVCNSDLYLADATFVASLRAQGNGAAILAPDITAIPSGRKQNPYMLSRPRASRMRLRRLMLSYRIPARLAILAARSRKGGSVDASPERREIYAPHGSFMLFHHSYFEVGGSFRHEPFLFAEEITVAEQCRAMGLSVFYEPALRVLHEEHQATGIKSGRLFEFQRTASVFADRLIRGAEHIPGAGSANPANAERGKG